MRAAPDRPGRGSARRLGSAPLLTVILLLACGGDGGPAPTPRAPDADTAADTAAAGDVGRQEPTPADDTEGDPASPVMGGVEPAGTAFGDQPDPALHEPLPVERWAVEDAAATPPGAGPWFVEDPAGVDHRNRSGPVGSAKRYLRDCIGQGLAVLDLDGDGRLDLYFPQGHDGSGAGGANRLYRNAGPRRFEALPDAAGAADDGFSFGALAFDADGDGRTDLLSTNDGPNRLYRNTGGRLQDVSAASPDLVGPAEHWSAGAAAADLDLDGDLDVYLANYLLHDPADLDRRGWCRFMGCEVPCGPLGLSPQPDVWLRNDGGVFVDAGASLGLDAPAPSFAFQPLFSDVDDDGDLDLYITNDSRANYLFVREGDGFVEDGLVAGVAVGRAGNREAGMGVACASVDGDRFPELYVTNFSTQVNAFYVNQAEPAMVWFEEQAELMGLGTPTYFKLSWGTSFADFDRDGRLDLFVANGHVFPQVDGCPPEEVIYAQANSLFVGGADDGRVWRDVGVAAGPSFGRAASHRGSLAADLDDDGDLDLVVNRLDERPLLLWNESPGAGHWLSVLVQHDGGGGRPTLSPGARVELIAGERRWMREVQVGSSFLATEDPRVHFGLGDVQRLDLRVRWPDGTLQEWSDVAVDRHLVALRGAAELEAR